MPAHTKPDTELAVFLYRDGQPTESAYARDGREARSICFDLLARRHCLRAGDTVVVRLASEVPS